MSRRNENWLLVEWNEGGQAVVHVNSVLKPVNKDLKIGDVITVNKQGEPHFAKLISRGRDREQLIPISNEDVAEPNQKVEEEPRDFSPSGESSWVPSDEEVASGDSDDESHKKIKLDPCKRQFINRRSSKKILTPSHRANAVIPKIMQNAHSKKNETNRKRPHNGISQNGSFNKSLPDSTKRNNTSKACKQTVTIDIRELAEIRNSFRVLFKMIEDLKRPTDNLQSHVLQQNKVENIIPVNEVAVAAVEQSAENDEYEIDELNRSDDNVLITNKYDKQYVSATNTEIETKKQTETVNEGMKEYEWVPIGSGKTLIHADQFKKVNWKSYTVATRTLLLAVFPRRILATHSLTGKPSPAFMNRPAKMCLDPKIICDVIMEIMDRFDVKENLVRSIITTKCADECKMWKQRVKKKKSNQSRGRTMENELVNDNFD